MNIKRRRLDAIELETASAFREFADFEDLLADATPDERARLDFLSPSDSFSSNIGPVRTAGSPSANFSGTLSLTPLLFADSLAGDSNSSNLAGPRPKFFQWLSATTSGRRFSLSSRYTKDASNAFFRRPFLHNCILRTRRVRGPPPFTTSNLTLRPRSFIVSGVPWRAM